jgi:hypothetical protein
VTGVKS